MYRASDEVHILMELLELAQKDHPVISFTDHTYGKVQYLPDSISPGS
jgi:hypothetical protein